MRLVSRLSPRLRHLAVGLVALLGLTGAGYATLAAPTATGSFSVAISGTQKNTVDLGTATFTAQLQSARTYATSGTGTLQIDRVWSDSSRILASAADTLDLAGGPLVDGFGNTFTCGHLKAMTVVAMDGNTNNVEIATPSSNGFHFMKDTSDVLVIPPGYAVGLGGSVTHSALAVTAGSADKMIVRNSGGSTAVSYKIELACTST
jgi:hypothetical protein